MPQRKGKTYWSKRKKNGMPTLLISGKKLWELFCDYATHCDENPLQKIELKENGDRHEQKTQLFDTVYTWEGLEDYLFEKGFFIDRKKYKEDDEFEEMRFMIRAIDNVIRIHKFQRAAAGIYNATLIAKDLGLSEKKELNEKIENEFCATFIISGKGIPPKISDESEVMETY